MNGIIHDMSIELARGDTMINPKFRTADGKIRTYDIVVANPMWNQPFARCVCRRSIRPVSPTGGVVSGKGIGRGCTHAVAPQ